MESPIFIVGCPRSGTTLMRLVLDSHLNISCGPETHFLGALGTVLEDRWDELQLFGFDRRYWNDKIADFFGSFQAEYAMRRGKRRWADKTPIYSRHLLLINELFPDCRVVHVIRDGRDVVASHRERWGYRRALKSVDRWRADIRMIREAGVGMGPGRYIEVRYEEMVGAPEPTLKNLLLWLGEPWDDRVLNYDRAEHDAHGRHTQHTAARRAAGNQTTAIYSSRVGAGKTALDPLLKTWFWLRSGRLQRQLGYG
jgi:Sulfotransferase family